MVLGQVQSGGLEPKLEVPRPWYQLLLAHGFLVTVAIEAFN